MRSPELGISVDASGGIHRFELPTRVVSGKFTTVFDGVVFHGATWALEGIGDLAWSNDQIARDPHVDDVKAGLEFEV